MPLSLTRDFKADPTGRQSAAPSLRDALQQHMAQRQRLVIEPGDYLLPHCGPDTDAVKFDVTGPINVVQKPGAVFHIQCDGEGIRGHERKGLLKEPVSIQWRGFAADQTAQPNGGRIPFRSHYSPVKEGESASCDAIGFRLLEHNSQVLQVVFNDYRIHAGEHWQIAGGDSGIFVEGGGVPVFLQRGYVTGSRDLGSYLSMTRTISRFNRFDSCFGGDNQKRGGSLRVFRNVYFNCPRPVACDVADRPASMADVIVEESTMIQSGTQGRFTNATRAWANNNWIIVPGAKLADGQPETKAGEGMFIFRNVGRQRARGNRVIQ